ncbi:MAG: hypothetical protein ABJD07_06505 [Gemmatimonadaceae bacterium]
MFGMFFGLATAAIALGSAAFGYLAARRFVRDKLRYVDAAQSRTAPLIAGVAACVVAAPIVALLPLVGMGTALLFGIGVGAGVAGGAGDVRRGTDYQITSGR